jgi:DNA-binding NarL/FixJ family response regulator
MPLASILLIDDDSFTRATLSAAINGSGLTVVASVDNASEALKSVLTKNPDVAVVDLDLGSGPSGIDICHALRKQNPQIGLVLLTSYSDPRIHDPANLKLPKGCRFLSKNEIENFSILLKEILIAKNKPLKNNSQTHRKSHELTNIQIQVLKSVADGLSTSEIAKIRGVSEKAIEATIAKTNKILGINKSKIFNQRVQLARTYFKLTGKKLPGE